MRAPLSLAVAQPSCVPHDVAANVATHVAAVRAAAARVVVFPELSLTGYELDTPSIASDDPRLEPLILACGDVGAVALVGAPVVGAGGREHIATLAVDVSGVAVAYRKTWVADTESRFAPGEPAVLVVNGWRLGLAICRDTGIAQHAADTAALGMDAYLAGTLMFDHDLEVQNERGRRIALTHRVPVAFASWAAPTGGGYARPAGHSSIWDVDGKLLAQAGAAPNALTRTTLNNHPH